MGDVWLVEGGLADADGFPVVDDLAGRPLSHYRLGAEIGRGSMGRVYEATHDGLGRPCALKVMKPGLVAAQPQVVERFRAEARAVAGLFHPNVVMVHNLGTDRGYHYIEMEFVPGGTNLRRRLIHGGPLDPAAATALTREVVLALGAAHDAGLVHRDVKPANVLLTADGRAKLADFGLVRRLDDGRGPGIAGTPTFMAPELFEGAPASPASDLYAVGVLYYYALSTRMPYVSDSISRLIGLHRYAPVPDVRRVAPGASAAVAAVIARCLAKAPEDRPASAADLSRLLGDLIDSDGPPAAARAAMAGLRPRGTRNGRSESFVADEGLDPAVLIEIGGEALCDQIKMTAVCAPADPALFAACLRLNAGLAPDEGSLSLREVDGRAVLALTRTLSGRGVSASALRDEVAAVSRRAAELRLWIVAGSSI